jgi:hypothetical protein
MRQRAMCLPLALLPLLRGMLRDSARVARRALRTRLRLLPLQWMATLRRPLIAPRRPSLAASPLTPVARTLQLRLQPQQRAAPRRRADR